MGYDINVRLVLKANIRKYKTLRPTEAISDIMTNGNNVKNLFLQTDNLDNFGYIILHQWYIIGIYSGTANRLTGGRQCLLKKESFS
jgi:hypothetical protein